MPTNKSNSSADNSDLPYIITHKITVLFLVAAAIFVVSFIAWWKHIYTSPSNVFEGMIKNNLSTYSVTRSSFSDNNGTKNDRVDQLSFVPSNGVHSLMKIEQKNADAENNVVTETIGTLSDDYNRYLSISTSQKGESGQPLDYKSIQNIWSKAESSAETPAQNYSQAALGLIMFANLDGATRTQVLKTLKDKNVYDVQYKDVKPLRINGKSALVIPVKINVAGYVEALKVVAKNIGLTNLESLNPETYKSQPPIEMKLTIDKLTRQLIKAEYNGNQTETYTNYGLKMPIQKPSKTISISELQQKIQEIK